MIPPGKPPAAISKPTFKWTRRCSKYANVPLAPLATISSSDVPAASAGASPEKRRSAGTRIKPPPKPTIEPNALANSASAKSARPESTTAYAGSGSAAAAAFKALTL